MVVKRTARRVPAKAAKATKTAKGTNYPEIRVRVRKPVVPPKKPRTPAKKPRRVAPAGAMTRTNTEAHALARSVAEVALAKKASDVLIIDTSARGSAVGYDYLVLATGDSEPQLDAVRSELEVRLKSEAQRVRSIEASPDWILLDLGDVVAHLLTSERRGQYDFEALWGDAPQESIAAHS